MKATRSFAITALFLGSVINLVAQNEHATEKPLFGELRCRADSQRWTLDPDNNSAKAASLLPLILVNGQLRGIPMLTYGATVSDLIQRAYEMQVCMHEDADFQNHFNTYQLIRDSYVEERTFRYLNFIDKHHLDDQFNREDKADFGLPS